MPRAPGIDRAPAGVESGYCCRSLSGSPAKVRRFGAACATDTVLEHQAHRPLPKVRTYTVGPLSIIWQGRGNTGDNRLSGISGREGTRMKATLSWRIVIAVVFVVLA